MGRLDNTKKIEPMELCPRAHRLRIFASSFQSMVVGGVFDHLHLGHKCLIQTAFQFAKRVHLTVMGSEWIKQENKGYSNGIQSFNKRVKNLEDFLDTFDLSKRAIVSKITDPYSYGVSGKYAHSIDSIVISTEEGVGRRTKKLNQLRVERKLSPLKILEIPLIYSPTGKPFSSTTIREERKEAGEKAPLKFSVAVSDQVKSELREKKGKLVDSVEDLPPPPTHVIAIGDVVTAELAKREYPMSIAIIDQKVRRRDVSPLRLMHKTTETKFKAPPYFPCGNPPGRLTHEAWHCLKVAFSQKRPVVLRIYGEEDLMGILATVLAPEGSLIVYGQPPISNEEGMVYFRVTEEKRSEAMRLLKEMKKTLRSKPYNDFT